MFTHAAVAIDHSEASDVILSCLEHFKQFGTEKLTLITSISQSYPGGTSTLDISAYQDKMDDYKSKAEAQGFEVDTRLEAGINAFPPVEILRTAKEAGAGWLILGNRGYSKVRELLLGSTASEILQRAELPVFLLNMDVTDEQNSRDRQLYCIKACRQVFDHVLHPTDFSATAHRALNIGGRYLGQKCPKWTLMHVQAASRINLENKEEVEAFDNKDTRRLTEMQQELTDRFGARKVDFSIRHGAPASEILAEADDKNVSLILMGSQGRGFMYQLFMGGVSLQIARMSRAPVLFIPAKR